MQNVYQVKPGGSVKVQGVVVDRWTQDRGTHQPGDYHVVKCLDGGGYLLYRTAPYIGLGEGVQVSVQGTALNSFTLDFTEGGRHRTATVRLINSQSEVTLL